MKHHLSIAGLVVVLLLFVGCSKSPVGTYVSQKNPDYYLELRKDGTFFLKEKMTVAGKYRVDGQTITLETSIGFASQGTIDGDTMTDKDGDKWTRK